jgi:predicted nucleic acid-binding protein
LKRVFVDTNYLGAVVNERDPLHNRAMQEAAAVVRGERVEFVTTLYVLAEFLAHVSKDDYTRQRGVEYAALRPGVRSFTAADKTRRTASLTACRWSSAGA